METSNSSSLPLSAIKELLNKANSSFDETIYLSNDYCDEPLMIAEYYMEKAFINTLIFLETKGLLRAYDKINALFLKAQKEGFTKSKVGIDEPYLVWSGELHMYLDALSISQNIIPSTMTISKDLESILRDSLYSITNPNIFDSPPLNEKEVHNRIEGVLECVFPDLRHKPPLTKPIKNFEPDTGLPSLRVLIEYKFISNQKEAKLASDQILADTRGYLSKDWDSFIYVIYETHRVKPESKWKQHLNECGVDKNTSVIVLCGEASKQKRISKTKKKIKKR